MFLLIDGHALIYRAYHAFPELTTPTGQLANAVYGFTRILLKSLRDFEPEYLAVCFDSKEETNRKKEFNDYKAHRSEMPDDLKPQIQMVKDVVDVLNIPRFEVAGFEADDLIGTLCRRVSRQQAMPTGRQAVGSSTHTLVVTGDKDLLQLVDDSTSVFIPGRGRFSVDTEYDAAMVVKKMGVIPEQIVDLKALMGDASDNIPGVKGVGKKTATKLIQAFGDLEGVYEAVGSSQQAVGYEKLKVRNEKKESSIPNTQPLILKGALLKKLIQDKDNAFLSQKLATIDTDAPIDLDLPACKVSGYDKQEALEKFDELGFRSLTKMLPKDDFELGLQDALF